MNKNTLGLANPRSSNMSVNNFSTHMGRSSNYVEGGALAGGRLGISPLERIKSVSRGIRSDYSHAVYQFILRHYSNEIVSMKVGRRPLTSAVNKMLSLATMGKWDKVAHNYGYDTFYHLFIVATLDTGKQIVIEKNAVINVGNYKPSGKTEFRPVLMTTPIKLGILLKNAESSMKNYFHYDSFSNNCQVFVYGVLKANGLLTPELTNFIKQDVSKVVAEQHSYLPTIARGITDLGGLADKFIEGETDRDEIKNKLKEQGGITQEALEGGALAGGALAGGTFFRTDVGNSDGKKKLENYLRTLYNANMVLGELPLGAEWVMRRPHFYQNEIVILEGDRAYLLHISHLGGATQDLTPQQKQEAIDYLRDNDKDFTEVEGGSLMGGAIAGGAIAGGAIAGGGF